MALLSKLPITTLFEVIKSALILDTFIVVDKFIVSLSITRLLSVLLYSAPDAIALIVYVSVGFSITDILIPLNRVMLFESLLPSRFTKFDPVFPSKDIYIYWYYNKFPFTIFS